MIRRCAAKENGAIRAPSRCNRPSGHKGPHRATVTKLWGERERFDQETERETFDAPSGVT